MKPLIIDAGNDFNVWYNSPDPGFTEINSKSRVPYKWLSYRYIAHKHTGKIIKPINRYVEALYPKPILIDDGTALSLRYHNHADFYLIDNYPGYDGFYNIDRPWMRQYYQTVSKEAIPENCFPGHYKFYVPWFIDHDVLIHISEAPGSPFHINQKEDAFRHVGDGLEFVEPMFVKFNFKRQGSHMEDNDFGIIRKGSPMFDIKILSDDILLLDKIRKFYDN